MIFYQFYIKSFPCSVSNLTNYLVNLTFTTSNNRAQVLISLVRKALITFLVLIFCNSHVSLIASVVSALFQVLPGPTKQ